MKSKNNINRLIGSFIMVAILIANVAPVAVYAFDGGDFGNDNYGSSDFGYDNYGSSDFGTDNYGYSDFGNDNYGSSDFGYDNYGSSDFGTDNYGYSDFGNDNYGSSDFGYDNYGSSDFGTDNYGYSDFGNDNYGSSDFGYDNYGSSDFGTDNYGYSDFGNDNYGSSDFGYDNYGSSDFGTDNYGYSDFGNDNYGSSNFGTDNYGSSNFNSSYSTPVYSNTQAQSAAQSYVQQSQPQQSQPKASTPTYTQPKQTVPTYTQTQPRVTTPTYTQPTYVAQTPTYTQPTYTTPTYTQPTTPVQTVPVCSINITPTQSTITTGSSVVISWTSTNASYVVLNGGIYSNTRVSNNGSYTVKPTVNTTYSVKCFNSKGQTNIAYSFITVKAVVTPVTPKYCANGATNYPTCTFPVTPKYCANGATNYPTCTFPTTPVNYCTNGATNYPYCTFPVNPTPTYVYCNGVQYPAGYVCPTQTVPSVSTTGATAYTTTATLFGYVNPNGRTALIWFDYGTDANNLQFQTSKQSTSITGAFSGNLSGLQCGTRYYYRAVAQTTYGTQYGATLSFITQACGNTGGGYYNNSSVVTRAATSVSYYQAQLNGAYISGSANNNSCSSFFDYGTNYNLGTRTAGQNLYSNYTVNYFSQAVFNLTPDTTYYYRAGVTCNDGTKYGNIVSFKTPAIKYTYTGGKKTTYTYNYVAPKTEVTETATCLCDTQTYLSLVIENLDGTSSIGKNVNYKIVYKNTSDETLKDVVIRVTLPDEMSIVGSDKGQYTKGGKTLIYTIDELKSLEDGTFILTNVVNTNVQTGRQMVVNAYANYTVPTVVKSNTPLSGEVTAYIVSIADNGNMMNPNNTNNNIDKDTSTSTGFWSFLPNSFFDWIVLIIVLVIFFTALRYVFGSFKKTA